MPHYYYYYYYYYYYVKFILAHELQGVGLLSVQISTRDQSNFLQHFMNAVCSVH